jgi:glycosyltransferase involved in cell wall biosynthesis
MINNIRFNGIKNKAISNYNSVKYTLTEPLALRIARLKYETGYGEDDFMPLISVYVPTYNRAELLMERAVDSVLKQTYENFEFIIVGDHCTDNTESLVSNISDKRIRFYNLPQRGYRYPPTAENHWFAGPVVAANTALSMVRGKWIARIDDDDIWTPDHLKVLLNFAQQGNFEFVSSSYIEERHGERYVVDEQDEYPRIGGTQTWLYRSYLKFIKYNMNCWRKKWNKVNDTDLQDRIFKCGVRIGFLDEVTCSVLPRPGETTIGLDAYKLYDEQKLEHFKF